MKAIVIMLFLSFFPSVVWAQGIDKAYQKEFTYLQAQKSALTIRLAELERDGARELGTKRAEIDALQNRLVALQIQGDGLQETLSEVQRDATTSTEHNESLDGVFEQARARGFEAGAEKKSLVEVFRAADAAMQESGEIRTREGQFFDAAGKEIKGEITYVGRIAALVKSSQYSGAVAPAGDGHLKAWPGTGGVFLFESLEKAVKEPKVDTWLDTIEAGGVIAWVIVWLGVAALVLILLRAFQLVLSGSGRLDMAQICQFVGVGRQTEAKRLVTGVKGARARVIMRAIEVVHEERQIAEDAVTQAILKEQPKIERFGTAIMVFAAVAPLLGLLGTVTGMIATFDIITEFGTGDPQMLSSGISEALITTQLGLMVAIPALLIGNLLNARANAILDGLEYEALRVLNSTRIEPFNEKESAAHDVPNAALEGVA